VPYYASWLNRIEATDGTKVPVGLYEGDSENTTVVTGLLADLVERRLDASGGILFVLDGATAMTKAVHTVFGDRALIQDAPGISAGRGRSPARVRAGGHRLQAGPGVHPPRSGPRAARRPRAGHRPGADAPSAAATIREGLEEMFTVRRLGLSASLERTLTTTNPVESMIPSPAPPSAT
jgi:hypothetical protein